jgi:hypothetical protein
MNAVPSRVIVAILLVTYSSASRRSPSTLESSTQSAPSCRTVRTPPPSRSPRSAPKTEPTRRVRRRPALATSLANQNALDGMSKVYSIELNKTARKVSVTTSAKEKGAKRTTLSPSFFARRVGHSDQRGWVHVRHPLIWGSPKARPYGISPRLLHLPGQGPTSDGSPPASPGSRQECQNEDCNYGPSGAAVEPEASAGWHQDPGEMRRHHRPRLERRAAATPGNNAPTHCSIELNQMGQRD